MRGLLLRLTGHTAPLHPVINQTPVPIEATEKLACTALILSALSLGPPHCPVSPRPRSQFLVQ